MLLSNLDLLATAPGGVARLRELILTLAVQGKLVPQDAGDEPASVLLERIGVEKERLIAEGRIRRGKSLAEMSDEEKPFGLPVGWEWARLQDIGYTQTGTTPDKKNPEFYGSHIPFIKPGDIYPEHVDYGNEALSALGLRDSGRVAPTGSILMVCIGTIGKTNIINRDCSFNQQISSITPLCCVPDFVSLYLRCPEFQSQAWARSASTTISILNKGNWEQIPVALPPLAEQSRILTRVEELMQLCDALEAKGRLEAAQHARLVSTLLATLIDSPNPEALAENWQRVSAHFDLLLDRPEAVDALEQTLLQLAVRGLLVPQDPQDEPAEILIESIQSSRKVKRRITVLDKALIHSIEVQLPSGWAWATVDQLAADIEYAITDGPFGANLKTEHYIAAKGYRVVRLQNIGHGKFREQHYAYIDRARFEQLEKHQVFSGDLLVAGLVDESIRSCRVPESLGPAIVKADCYRFAVHKAMNAGYVDLYLGSKIAHEFAAVHHHGLTLTRIGLGNFRSIPVPTPPTAEQSRIVARVASLRRLCADLRQRLTARQATQAQLAHALIKEAA